ncbi:MAG: 3-deoxy-7-phosphoheptulonate synthase [bacterium]
MLIYLEKSLPSSRRKAVLRRALGLCPGKGGLKDGTIWLFPCAPGAVRLAMVEALPGVEKVEVRLDEISPLACSGKKKLVKVGQAQAGGKEFLMIAGPCAVESRAGYLAAARFLKKAGVHALRGGIFKPRSSPYAFQGMGYSGLDVLGEAKRLTGLPVVTEVTDPRQLEKVGAVADVIQCGARNMRNYELLKELGGQKRPVLLKRAAGASLREWLLSAEYVLKQGNSSLMLCERGDRCDSAPQPSLNLEIAREAAERTGLPVIIDPSHGTGRRSLIAPAVLAAAAAAFHGVMVEVHQNPHNAIVDGKQTLSLEEFAGLSRSLHKMLHTK